MKYIVEGLRSDIKRTYVHRAMNIGSFFGDNKGKKIVRNRCGCALSLLLMNFVLSYEEEFA